MRHSPLPLSPAPSTRKANEKRTCARAAGRAACAARKRKFLAFNQMEIQQTRSRPLCL